MKQEFASSGEAPGFSRPRVVPVVEASVAGAYADGEAAEGPLADGYAIVTRQHHDQPLALDVVAQAVQRFLVYAAEHPQLVFEIAPIGEHGRVAEIGPWFAFAPGNCILPTAYAPWARPAPLLAPFSAQQVEAMNRWQAREDVHPLTCGTADHRLVAGSEGLSCKACDHVQPWAPALMDEG